MSPFHYDNNKPKYIRYAMFAVLILIVSLLQNSNVAFPEIFGARAFLLLPLSVVISMHEREIPAAIFGAFSGALWDVCSANDGFNTLVLMLLSAISSILISHFMRRNVITSFVLSAGAVGIYNILYVIVNLLGEGAGNPLRQMIIFYLPSTIYTLVFVPVFYFLVDWIFENYKTE